ncbi:MAG TPA: hypothetical protein VL263_00770 [Vicinamibacterales bacterium]|nr:hypothetical protein [Vicinamibacterales bacterium]
MLTHLLFGLILVAQSPSAPPPAAQEATAPIIYKITGSRIAIAQDVEVSADEEIQDAVVAVGGSLRAAGRIRHGAVVIGGDIHLLPSADVQGDLVLVGGTLIRDPGARVAGAISYVSLGDWSRSVGLFDWRPRLQFGTASRWVSLIATIFRVSILAALMVFVLLIARAPVARVGRAAAAAPFRAAVVGLAAEVLFLPLLLVASIALGITIIGLPLVFLVVPLAFVLAFFALMLGYTALACRLGEWLEDRLGWQLHSAYLATAIGLLLIVFPTLLSRLLGVAPAPLRMAAFGVLVAGVIAEFLVWTIGLGAALMTGLGRRNTFDAIDVHV